MPIGRPAACSPPLPPCPIFPSLLPFPFPWSVVPTKPLDFPCFTALCQVHTEEGNFPRCWPGAFKRSSQTGGVGPSPTAAFWALGCRLAGSIHRRAQITTLCLSFPALSPPCGERIMYPLPPLCVHGVCIELPFPRVVRVDVVGGRWHRVLGGDGWFLLCALGVA